MKKILVISGKKQSGKSSASNFIHGYLLREAGVIKKLAIDEETGLLITNAAYADPNGQVKEMDAYFSFGEDRVLTEPAYVEYAERVIWKHVKRYSFADPLKLQAMQLFHLTIPQCYGSDEDKNSFTTVKWEYFARVFGKTQTRSIMRSQGIPYAKSQTTDNHDPLTDYVTARQFMQVYGTEICRAIHPDCWLDATIDRIFYDSNVPLAIIDDARFQNEVEKVVKLQNTYEVDVKTIRLLRNPHSDDHSSETALDGKKDFDLVVPPEVGFEQKHDMIVDAMAGWGWI